MAVNYYRFGATGIGAAHRRGPDPRREGCVWHPY